MRGLVRQRITGVIKELWSAATVVAYGSTMTHMALPNSDIDLAVAAGYTGAHPWFELVSRLVKAGVCTAESTQVKRFGHGACAVVAYVSAYIRSSQRRECQS